jgi:hypothetical protein
MIHVFNIIRNVDQTLDLFKHEESKLYWDRAGIVARMHFLLLAGIYSFDYTGTIFQLCGLPGHEIFREQVLFKRISLVFVSKWVPENEHNERIFKVNAFATTILAVTLFFPQFQLVFYGLSALDAFYRSNRIIKDIKQFCQRNKICLQ